MPQDWPQDQPILASYEVQDVIDYLGKLSAALGLLLRLLDNDNEPANTAAAAINVKEKRCWIGNLPAQLHDEADWEIAGSAYLQLMEGFDDFMRPFPAFVSAAYLLDIPYSHVAFDVWVLERFVDCLEESEIGLVRETGVCTRVELCDGVRACKTTVDVLIGGYLLGR